MRNLLFAVVLALGVWLLIMIALTRAMGAPTSTNYFTGSIQYSPCEKSWVVTWSNVPPNVEFQFSQDLTNWSRVLTVYGTDSNWESLSYRITDTNTTFMRLRQLP